MGPPVLDDSRGLQMRELPATSGRQQRSISYKRMDRCFSEVIFHITSFSRKKFWNSALGSRSSLERVFPFVIGPWGIMRCGFGFINGLGAVLILTHWISVPTGASALDALISGGRGAEELKQGRNVYERVGKTLESKTIRRQSSPVTRRVAREARDVETNMFKTRRYTNQRPSGPR